jgi:hypothetical protein
MLQGSHVSLEQRVSYLRRARGAAIPFMGASNFHTLNFHTLSYMIVTVPVYSPFQYYYFMYLFTAKTSTRIGIFSGKKTMMILKSIIDKYLGEMMLRSLSHLSQVALWMILAS